MSNILSGWGLLATVLVVVALLGLTLFTAGRPGAGGGAAGGPGWRAWTIGAALLLGVLLLLNYSLSKTSYQTCYTGCTDR